MGVALHDYFNARNSHLLVSSILVVAAALMYGLAPAATLPQMFDIRVETIDLSNVFRVNMCIYLSVSGVWIAGIVSPPLWRAATFTNIIFMASLTSGRVISLIFDGVPSINLKFAMVGELLLTVYGVVQWRRFTMSDSGPDAGN